MIAKKFRFHGYGSLKFAYSKGRSSRAQFLSLKYIANERRKDSRLAVVVSKKISKKAPVRNRIRRRLYEAVRLQWADIAPGTDMVISVFDERVGTLPAAELTKLVDDLLRPTKLHKASTETHNS